MRRALFAVAVAAATCAASTAYAHQGNPNMQSVVRSVTPKTPGVSIDVLNRDDRFLLTNRSGEPIVIYGYNEDQYARLLPDGTVQVNKRSPAFYLNDDRYADVKVPAFANAKAPPQWTTLDKTGRFQWHDHRMHYMARGVPPSVKDKSKRQRIFNYEIPVKIGGRNGTIAGTLLWTPEPGGGAPVAAIVAFVVIAGAGVVAMLITRRRRAATPGQQMDKESW